MKHAALLATLPLAACTATGERAAPPELTALYDMVAPDGAMELELDRDGTFLELEAEVAVDRVPAPLVSVVTTAFPGARLTGAEREVQGGDWTWEVKFEHDGRTMEAVLEETGRILEVERELRPSEAPAAVLAAAEAAVPGGALTSVESIEADGTTYHVKRTRDGARYKIVLDAEGNVLRKVREVPAEIEIPLAD